MAVTIRNAYQTLPPMFDKFNNLCTASIQFVYLDEEDIAISDSEPIQNFNHKTLITSSAYIDDLYDDTHNNPSGILSWPLIKPSQASPFGKLRSTDNTGKGTGIYKKIFSNNDNTLCAQSLDLQLNEYNNILKNQDSNLNPVFYFQKHYEYDDFKYIKHSEPLLAWWIESGLESLKNNFIQTYEIDEDDLMYPIVHFYTSDQTCLKCESLIQKSSCYFQYLPIISFSKQYVNENGLDGYGCKLCEVKNNKK